MSVEQQLRQELAALRHELRRICDRLEANRSRELERRAQQLRENITLCERDLNQVAATTSSRSSAE